MMAKKINDTDATTVQPIKVALRPVEPGRTVPAEPPAGDPATVVDDALVTRLRQLTESVRGVAVADYTRVARLRQALAKGYLALDDRATADHLAAFEAMLARRGRD